MSWNIIRNQGVKVLESTSIEATLDVEESMQIIIGLPRTHQACYPWEVYQ